MTILIYVILSNKDNAENSYSDIFKRQSYPKQNRLLFLSEALFDDFIRNEVRRYLFITENFPLIFHGTRPWSRCKHQSSSVLNSLRHKIVNHWLFHLTSPRRFSVGFFRYFPKLNSGPKKNSNSLPPVQRIYCKACNTKEQRGMYIGFWWETQKQRDH
jgi:hypothetical protein